MSAFFEFDTSVHKFEMDLGRLAPASEVTGGQDRRLNILERAWSVNFKMV
jgi:hypothetical protein